MNISFWKHHPLADQSGRQLAEKTIDFQHKFNLNIVKLTPAGTWLAVCYGLQDAWRGDGLGRREIMRPLINHPDDWQTLVDFRRGIPRMLNEQLLAAQLTRSACSDSPVYATVFSPISQAIQLAGIDQVLDHWQHYPVQLMAGLRQLTKNLCFVLEEFNKLAIQGVYYVVQHARTGGLPVARHRQLSEFSDRLCLESAAQLFADVIVHLHGQNSYFPIDPCPSALRLHYTARLDGIPVSLKNLPPHQSLLPGLPTDVLIRCQTLDMAWQALACYYPLEETANLPHLMGECVLPLNFSATQIELWKQVAKLPR
ncbi:uroporphyrinogen decarboxylase/cobalamine-independent methonine synthase family protein [Spirosoma aerolatum]|uniref:hypothetical protein n=1 Tax=Spirosoma aerolatum TaxID=1211326 RepID=UPI0009AE2B15|nr:hypothetical protein [Spirosoma aerolatum]